MFFGPLGLLGSLLLLFGIVDVINKAVTGVVKGLFTISNTVLNSSNETKGD